MVRTKKYGNKVNKLNDELELIIGDKNITKIMIEEGTYVEFLNHLQKGDKEKAKAMLKKLLKKLEIKK